MVGRARDRTRCRVPPPPARAWDEAPARGRRVDPRPVLRAGGGCPDGARRYRRQRADALATAVGDNGGLATRLSVPPVAQRADDSPVDKAKAAEISSRGQSKNVRSGYAAKKARDNDPGGHPPFGFRRDDAKLIEPDPEAVPIVRRIVDLSASGATDRTIAAEFDLAAVYRAAPGRESRELGTARGSWDMEPGAGSPQRPGDQCRTSGITTPPLRPLDAPLRGLRRPTHRRHRLLPT